MGDRELMNRKSESLFKFTGAPSDYPFWANKFMDHMGKVHIAWKPILKWMQTSKETLSMRRLRVDSLGPHHENAADLATKLEQVIVDYLPSTQYNKRSQLCGGEGEEGIRVVSD